MKLVKIFFVAILVNCGLCSAWAHPGISSAAIGMTSAGLPSSASGEPALSDSATPSFLQSANNSSLNSPANNRELAITFSADKVPVINVEKDIYTQLVAAQADDSMQWSSLPKHRSINYFSEPDALSVVLLLALSVLYKFRLRPKARSISRN